MTVDVTLVLDRSEQLAVEIHAGIQFVGELDEPVSALALAQAMLSFELAHGFRRLLQASLDAAALALVRVQFESTIRAVWIASAASEQQLARYAELDAGEGLTKGNQGPSVPLTRC